MAIYAVSKRMIAFLSSCQKKEHRGAGGVGVWVLGMENQSCVGWKTFVFIYETDLYMLRPIGRNGPVCRLADRAKS